MNKYLYKTNKIDKDFTINNDIISPLFMIVLSGCFVVIPFMFSPWAPVVMASVICLVLIINKWPEFGLTSILLLTSSIVFEESLPSLSIGVGSIYMPDVFLAILLMFSFFAYRKKSNTNNFNYLDKLLVVFFASATIAAINAIYFEGVSISDSLGRFRIISYYSLYFVVALLIRTSRQIKALMLGICAVTIVVSIAMIIQATLGTSMAIVPGRVESAVEGGAQAARILPPGQMLVFIILVVCSIYIVTTENIKRRFLCYFLFSLCGISVLLTYNRSYWVSYFLVMSLFFLITNKKSKLKIISNILSPIIIFMALVFLVSIVSPGSVIDKYYSSITTRAHSLFAGEDLFESDSIDFRRVENEAAFRAIAAKPLLGSGLGSTYREVVHQDFKSRESYIHNGYLWIVLKMGLVGAVPFILFLVLSVARAIKNSLNLESSHYKTLMLCGAFSIAGVLLINVVSPVITQAKSIVVIATVMGLLRSLERISNNESGGYN